MTQRNFANTILVWNLHFEIDITKETYLTITTENSAFRLNTVKIQRNPFRPREGRNLKAFCIRWYTVWIFPTRHKGCRLRKAPIEWYLRDACPTCVSRAGVWTYKFMKLWKFRLVHSGRHSLTKRYLSFLLFEKKNRYFSSHHLQTVIFNLASFSWENIYLTLMGKLYSPL